MFSSPHRGECDWPQFDSQGNGFQETDSEEGGKGFAETLGSSEENPREGRQSETKEKEDRADQGH